MERQTLSEETLAFIAERRAYHRAQADDGADDDLPEQHRRNRAHVLGPYCRVQDDDDVLLNGERLRVIGAARGEGWFYALQENPWSGNLDVPMDGQYITDRAPANANDEPLPIRIDPPPPPPHEPGGPPVMNDATSNVDVDPEDA